MDERARVELSDLPAPLRRHARAVAATCMLLLLSAVLAQVAASVEWLDDPWLPLGLGFLSSAAIGIDAMVVGVRKRRGVGPSIANLTPGGWALFGAMLWIVAVPAYLFGARRRARRGGEPDDDWESVTWGSWVGVALVATIGAAIGLLTSLSG